MEKLASFAHEAQVSDDVREQAFRAWTNYLAAAIHGAHTSEGQKFLNGVAGLGEGDNPVVGVSYVKAVGTAALVNGAFAHIDDFDDTHLETVSHPSTPVIAAIYANFNESYLDETVIYATAVGTEVVIRMAQLVHPSHYDCGWHVTASVGGIGAAMAVGILKGLSVCELTMAGALAALQPGGLRAAFGTMGKSFQVGRASELGVTAAVLAQNHVDAPADILEARRGFRITSEDFHPDRWNDLGTEWEFLRDTFKPYPCGIVTHPLIDLGIMAHGRGIQSESVKSVELSVDPLVLELTDIQSPSTGLEIKFSARTLFAVALIHGTIDLSVFEQPPFSAVQKLATRVTLVPDPRVPRDSARMLIRLANGNQLKLVVEHARGSLANPLGWGDLKKKFMQSVLPEWGSWECWNAMDAARRGGASLSDLPAVFARR